MFTLILFTLMLGALAGVLAGLLGIGGGLVIVPGLVWVFGQAGFEAGLLMHLAVGTSLATIVFTSLSSIQAHHRRGAVRWPLVAQLAVGVLGGAALGSYLAAYISGVWLARIFGVFVLLVALQLASGWQPRAVQELPGRLALGLAGSLIGAVSVLVGIGGGSMTVPLLAACRVPMREAVATSAAVGLPIAVAGALGFVLSGLGRADLPPWSSGFVVWPAFLTVVLVSFPMARIGASLAHRVPAVALRRIFALFLVLVGVRMLWI